MRFLPDVEPCEQGAAYMETFTFTAGWEARALYEHAATVAMRVTACVPECHPYGESFQ